ncbi:phosphogluconate dehydratase [Hirschia baltica]|uniref:Phosphogluconate dehydratase n=1 Tax=Hirschia baltica (strain ATCC 49814 / DSM 5838 / IFAM 1418) TaxID=582402 RepID=C6XJD9_HIRBI|nr:phosphogluconate dehydratase [Hirschia baltica]ACT59234.1 6-phosphogluconate dehydratase [Hirschia baltica ATCC 49814]
MAVSPINKTIADVTDRIIKRSEKSRASYLSLMDSQRPTASARSRLTDGNLAHASAACPIHDKNAMLGAEWPNIGIVTAYNDMLSAHQPYEKYPDIIRAAARKVGATAQVAGGVPAMCDGVTQGQDGMELSLFSRDTIALSTAVALSHSTFDAALYLGICDKIVPGLLIAAVRFGWLPGIFVPAGPMPSGLPNPEKQRIRQLYAAGEVGRDALLKAESESYHTAGTCTFYGTANSNQMMMEMMGLHIPGAAFVPPGTNLRTALTEAAAQQAAAISHMKGEAAYTPISKVIDERSIVNAVVGLMATGGSTNNALHIPAIARAAGILINWSDFQDIADVTPLLCKIYPNGPSDVNHFHAAGGMGFVVRELLASGLVHNDVTTVAGDGGLERYCEEPTMNGETLTWKAAPEESLNEDVLRTKDNPMAKDGGLKLIDCPIGRGIIKISAVKEENRKVSAPAAVFDSQHAVKNAFEKGELHRDVVIVVRFQGPQANGMPELHGLSPILGLLQDKGFKVALITDGRMSGASGKFPAIIHMGPEALAGGPIASIQDGDLISLDANAGTLTVQPDDFLSRPRATREKDPGIGLGREMFAVFRNVAEEAEKGGGIFGIMDA